MALSSVRYTGTGALTDFTIPFPYTSPSDIHVSVNGVDVPYTYINAAAIRCNTAPAAGTQVKVYRVTPKTASPVNFTDGSNLLEADLDALVSWTLFVSQEAAEAASPLPAADSNKILGWNSTGTDVINYSAAALGVLAAYGTGVADVFVGDGVTTTFTLSANPVAIANLDVHVAGLGKIPGIDYTWTTGTGITFAVPPALGARVLCRFMQGLPEVIPVDVPERADQISVFSFMSPEQIADVKARTLVLDVTAALQAAINGGARFVPDGSYKITSTLNLPSSTTLYCASKAYFMAGVDGLTVFSTTGFTSSVKVHDAHVLGNGHVGVTAFRLKNVQFDSALYAPNVFQCQTGIVLDEVCIGVALVNPTTYRVVNGIQILGGSNANTIINPAIDNAAVSGGSSIGTGVYITGGTNHLIGGFIQGFEYGVYDSGSYTKIDGPYVEECTNCAVQLSASIGCAINNLFYFGYSAAAGARYAVVGSGSSGCTIMYPKMVQGNSTGGLYYFASGNSNCVEAHLTDGGTTNTSVGVMTQLSSLTLTEASATFTPVVAGSTMAGTCTYSTQNGRCVRVGNLVTFTVNVAWTGHTGTGDIILSGFPIAPGAGWGDETFQVVPSSFAVTGPHVRGYFSSAAPFLKIIQVSTVGAGAPVTVPAAGALAISGTYFAA